MNKKKIPKEFTAILKEGLKLTSDSLYFYETYLHLDSDVSKKAFPKAFTQYAPFITVVKTSVFFSLILTLCKLGEKDGSTVAVRRLIREATDKGIITTGDRDTLNKQLAILHLSEKGVRRIRNNHVGHLSASEEIGETYKIAKVKPQQLETLAKGYSSLVHFLAEKATISLEDVERRLDNLHQNLKSVLTRLNS